MEQFYCTFIFTRCHHFDSLIDIQGHHFSVANFAKFRGKICEILWHYCPQIPYILRTVGVVVLTDNTSKYKEFIVMCNVKTLLLAVNDD